MKRHHPRTPFLPAAAHLNGLLPVITLGAGLIVSGCASTAPMTSTWRAPGISVDSSAREWKSPFIPVNETHLFVGMQNDSAYFYIRILAPEEEFRRRIAGPGMTVWFQPDGGKKTGILYPMGTGLHDLEILGEDKNDRTLFSPLDAPGISVRVGSSEGSSMYELKIPLQATQARPYAVGAAPGSTFRIEIQTEKETGAVGREGEGMGGGRYPGGGEGGGFGGGRGGRGGGFGGGRGGRGGGGVSRFDALDFKADVHLAGPPAGTAAR